MPILYTYLKAVDQCLVRLTKPNKLIEGDWIMENIKVGNKLIRNTVHGLNTKDIEILRKARKSVYVKNGIPFIPAILIVVIIMVFFSLTSGPNWILYWFPF
jgi:t-SNARE complex subunit (syntaxin)